jgi:hypothetical protein
MQHRKPQTSASVGKHTEQTPPGGLPQQGHATQHHKILRTRFCDVLCNLTSMGGKKGLVAILNFLDISSDHNQIAQLSACGKKAAPNLPILSEVLPTNLTALKDWASSNFSWASRLTATEECGVDSPLLQTTYGTSTMEKTAMPKFQSSRDVEASRRPRDLLSVLQLVAKVHEMFLVGGTVKRLRQGNANENLFEIGEAMINQLRRNSIGKQKEGMDKAETQTQLFRRRVNPVTSSFVLDSTASSQFCAHFGVNKTAPSAGGVRGSSSGDPQQDAKVELKWPQRKSPKPLMTAVCLVGATRTLARDDVMQAFRYRFLSGWGIENALLFTVLVPEGETNQSQAIEILAEHK